MTRDTDIGSKILWLEFARFIAAFLVMGVHLHSEVVQFAGYPSHSLPYFDVIFFPAAPVDFFFVLSGFVMYQAHGNDFGKWRRLPHYALSRFCRIYPLYWLSILAVQAVWDVHLQKWQFFQQPLFQLLSLSPTRSFAHTVEVNGPAWSLRFEIAFYIGLAAMFLPRIGRLFMAVWLFAVLWINFPFFFLFRDLPRLTGCYPSLWPEALTSHWLSASTLLFFAGLGAGAFYRHIKLERRLNLVLLVLCSLAMAWEWKFDLGGWRYPAPALELPVGIAYGMWMAALARAEQLGMLPRWRALRVLGVISYPLYLLHISICWAFTCLLPSYGVIIHRIPGVVWFFTLMVIALTVAWIVAYWIDRPLQNILRIGVRYTKSWG